MTNTRILGALRHPTSNDVVPGPPSPSKVQTCDRILSRSLPLRQPIGRQDGSSVPPRQSNRNAGWVGESGNSVNAEWPRIKIALAVTWQGGGGQYKMYKSIIFINFISRSKKVKPKSKSCRKHFFTVYKLLRL